ncbi:unnamed protein product [Polarella glacialis]|uniref:Uncharacterized protein n=1 Tax=Polarella glacialis TaxID=89957 RepID=A0A813LX07_POLGL|nr:unnamed protein product [Polarella glacialis]
MATRDRDFANYKNNSHGNSNRLDDADQLMKLLDSFEQPVEAASQKQQQPNFSVSAENWSVVVPGTFDEAVGGSAGSPPSQSRRKQAPLKPVSLPERLGFLSAYQMKPHAVEAIDMRKEALAKEMSSLKLSEHFDGQGGPRFRRLGLAFAAKSLLPQQAISFGSKSEVPHLTEREKADRQAKPGLAKATKAFILSQEAVLKDLKQCEIQSALLVESISPDDRMKDEDVNRRQADILFLEVSNFRLFLPRGVEPDKVERVIQEANEFLDEQRARTTAGRAIGFFDERGWLAGHLMDWTYRQTEVLALSEVANYWSIAVWNKGASIGMDRATFCRFILDVGLVDQKRVPYFWAVSLFDQMANHVRCCSLEEASPGLAPLLPVVNRWELISVLEIIIRKHFGSDHKDRSSFLQSLLDIAKFRLPPHVFENGRFSAEQWHTMARGGWGEEKPEKTSESEHASALAALFGGAAGEDSGNKGRAHRRRALVVNAEEKNEEQNRSQEQRLHNMLVEPEVVQLLWQQQDMFRNLFQHYVDEASHMSFGAVAQFCSDFHLAPRLVSSHQLRKLYESVKCVDLWDSPLLRTDSCRSKVSSKGSVGHVLRKAASGHFPEKQAEHGAVKSPRAPRKVASSHREIAGAARLPTLGNDPSPSELARTPSPTSPKNPAFRMMPSLVKSKSGFENAKNNTAVDKERLLANATEAERRTRRRVSSSSSSSTVTENGDDFDSDWPVRFPWHGVLELVKGVAPAPQPEVHNLHNHFLNQHRQSDKSHHAPIRQSVSQRPPSTALSIGSRNSSPTKSMTIPHPHHHHHKEDKELKETKAVQQGITQLPATFGWKAFTEFLCRLGFTYLSFYGNMQQRSMPGFLQVTWLLSYMRWVFEDQKERLENHRRLGRAAEVEQALGAFGKLLQQSSAIWDQNPLPEFEDGLPTTVFHNSATHTPEVLALMPPKRPKPTYFESASPCIVNGICRLCQSKVGQEDWGNLRCYACAKLDTLPLKHHPFAALLVDRRPRVKPQLLVASKHPRIRRSPLSPPPVTLADSFQTTAK